MDVFSAGCVVAELFLESPIFSLSQLYRYRRGEYDPAISHLTRIPDRDLRDMIAHMIQLDPQKRYSAEQYLEFWRKKVFPDYFYSFLHQYMELITDPSSGQHPISGATRNLGEADERIDRVYYDFDKISYFLGYQDDKDGAAATAAAAAAAASQIQPIAPRLGLGHFPVRLNIPNNEHHVRRGAPLPADNGSLIFLTLVVASLRNTARSASKIRACDVLLAFAERLADDAKLDRVLPYLMSLLNDKADMVVMAAIRTTTQLLSLVNQVSPINAHVFLEYVLPRMQIVLSNTVEPPRPLVRATYASCLGTLASTASRFLDVAAAPNASGSITRSDPEVDPANGAAGAAFDEAFDEAKRNLVELLERHTKALIEDPDPFVRRAFLSSVPELCIFFGAADANYVIVSHLNTYLNDRDWMLKCALFDTIVGVAAFLGSVSLEEFILPLMIQALTDPEEHVVQAVLRSLAELASLGLFSKPMVLELIEVVIRFTVHPNIWIREAATMFLSTGSKYLSPAERRCILYPLASPYLKADAMIEDCSELALLEDLKRPLSRSVFDQALNWALKTDRGVFWRPLQKLRGFAFGMSSPGPAGKAGKELDARSLNKVARNDEDEQWLSRLRNLGLSQDDEFKLLALREFIWRLSRIKLRDAGTQEDHSQLNNIIQLRSLGITPQTVLFEDDPPRRPLDELESDNVPRSIEDALQDASMTIDDPVSRRRRAALNSHRSRFNRQNSASPASPDSRLTMDDDGIGLPIGSNTIQGTASSSADPSRRSSAAPEAGKLSAPGAADDGSLVAQQAPYAARRGLRHQTSAISLLNRKESVKTGPETGTTEANAFGRVEGRYGSSASARSPTSNHGGSVGPLGGAGARYRSNHSYAGNDPNVLRMLDAMFVENYPHDIAEFGPLVTPIGTRKNSKLGGNSIQETWRPSGKMVTTFSEHTGAIKGGRVARSRLLPDGR